MFRDARAGLGVDERGGRFRDDGLRRRLGDDAARDFPPKFPRDANRRLARLGDSSRGFRGFHLRPRTLDACRRERRPRVLGVAS